MPGLKFRVLLDSDKNEEVFRDILIANDADFETFYRSIMSAFSFSGDQMASFYVSNDSWDKGHELSLLDMTYDDETSPYSRFSYRTRSTLYSGLRLHAHVDFLD